MTAMKVKYERSTPEPQTNPGQRQLEKEKRHGIFFRGVSGFDLRRSPHPHQRFTGTDTRDEGRNLRFRRCREPDDSELRAVVSVLRLDARAKFLANRGENSTA